MEEQSWKKEFDMKFWYRIVAQLRIEDLEEEMFTFIESILSSAERKASERAAEERERSKRLWDILDEIDTLPDMLHPYDSESHEKTWRIMVERASKRHEILTTDGYELYPVTQEDKSI